MALQFIDIILALLIGLITGIVLQRGRKHETKISSRSDCLIDKASALINGLPGNRNPVFGMVAEKQTCQPCFLLSKASSLNNSWVILLIV